MGDGTFSPAKKRGLEVGKTKKGKGTKLMLMTDGKGIPVSAFTTSAQVAEVNTIETLVDVTILDKRPDRLLYDKAADANWLRDALDVRGIEQITPHRRSRKKQSRQDGTLPPTVQASMEGRANIQLARQLPTHSGSTRILCLISSKASSTGHACYYVSSSFETASRILGLLAFALLTGPVDAHAEWVYCDF